MKNNKTKIVKVPAINGLNKTNDCENAPQMILDSLKNLYSNESGKEIKQEDLDISEVSFQKGNINETNKNISFQSEEFFKSNFKERFVFLGGDHSISFPLVSSFLKRCNLEKKESCLIVFDAHPDLMSAVDKNSPSHEEWLYNLIERSGFFPENILLVGTRNLDPFEREFIKKKKIKTIDMDQFVVDMEETCDYIMEFVQGRELYVSLDIDVIDPVFAPGTYYKEPGGFTSREIIYLIKRIQKIINFRVLDIVEVNPKLDKNKSTINISAKILSEII